MLFTSLRKKIATYLVGVGEIVVGRMPSGRNFEGEVTKVIVVEQKKPRKSYTIT